MKTKVFVSTIAVLAMLGAPMYSLAQTTGTTTVSGQVQALLNQIKNLQTQLQALKAAQQQVIQTLQLVRSLSQGMSGDDVKTLQAILAADPSIYPEGLVTGFYGSLTSKAVKRFQQKYGIEALGLVGPKTLKKLNEEIGNLNLSSEDKDENEHVSSSTNNIVISGEKKLCVKVPPGHLIAPGWLKKNAAPVVPTCQTLPPGIANKLQTTTTSSTTSSTTPDMVAPVISGVSTSNLLATTTNVVWTTNELSTSKVWFGTSTPLALASSTLVSSATLVAAHTLSLSGLATSTMYYYVVVSSDASGNTATSSQNSFVTLSN